MRPARALSLALLAAVAVPWAAALTLAGLWLLSPAAEGLWPVARPVTVAAGVALIAAGQLVFLVCVADRVCPAAGRRLGPWFELPLSVVVCLASIAVAALLAAGLVAGAAA